MKRTFFLLSFFAQFLSCTKTDKSSFNKRCTDSCATVQGRFITGNNEGISNIAIELNSESRPSSGFGQTTKRKIASGKTDHSGYYSLTFGLEEGEYGEMAVANLSINFTYNKTSFLPVTWYESFGTYELLGRFTRKDTAVNANIYVASRAKLKVRLENFIPVQSGDFFSIVTSCGVGLERHYESGGFLEANQSSVEQEVDACGNEQTTVIIRRRKNGIYSFDSTTIFTPTGLVTPVSYTY